MSFFPSKCQAEMGRKSVGKSFGREWRSTPQEQIMIRSANKNEFQAYFLKNHEIVKKNIYSSSIATQLSDLVLAEPTSGKPGVYMSLRTSRQQTTRRSETIVLEKGTQSICRQKQQQPKKTHPPSFHCIWQMLRTILV